jgi:hypothetical protein
MRTARCWQTVLLGEAGEECFHLLDRTIWQVAVLRPQIRSEARELVRRGVAREAKDVGYLKAQLLGDTGQQVCLR